MNNVVSNMFFTKMYIVHDDGIKPELCKWTNLAIDLNTIDSFYDITGINEMLENKTKLITDRGWEYIIDISFAEFKEIFMEFVKGKKTELFKASGIQNKN